MRIATYTSALPHASTAIYNFKELNKVGKHTGRPSASALSYRQELNITDILSLLRGKGSNLRPLVYETNHLPADCTPQGAPGSDFRGGFYTSAYEKNFLKEAAT